MTLTEEQREHWFSILENLPPHRPDELENRLTIESTCSWFLGIMWTSSCIPEAQGVSLAELEMVFIQFFLNRGDAWSAAVLAAMTDLAEAPSGRRAAAKAVERLRETGVEPPSWYGEEVTLDGCWKAGDLFGDWRTYILSFKAPSGNLAISYSVEFSEYHFDMALGCDVSLDGPEPLLRAYRERHEKYRGQIEPQRCDPEEVVRNTMRSLDDWDIFCVHGEVEELDQTYLMMRELWKSRLRLLPPVASYRYERPGDEELSLLASGFLNHLLTERPGLLDDHAMEAIRELCWFHAFTAPRVSPTRMYVFLKRYMPAHYDADDPVVRAVKRLFTPFVLWTAAVTDLPAESHLHLARKAERLLEDFPGWTRMDPDVNREPRPRR